MNQLHLSEITRREQLFDLINDPGELYDLAAEPAHKTPCYNGDSI